MKQLVSLICLLGCALVLTPTILGQGVAVPARPNRPPPKLKINLAPPKVQFQDIAAQAGLTAPNVSGPERDKQYIIETTGSGVALFDYDRDGWLDVFIVNGTTLAAPPQGQEGPTSHLYRNRRDGTFADVTRQAGLVRTGWGQGVCAGDYDNDGDTDLVVTYWGQNALWRNNNDGTFTDVAAQAGLHQQTRRWSTGCSLLDYDKDGDLDLFVANYVDLDLNKTPARGSNDYCSWKGLPVVCGPRGLPPGVNLLYRNDLNGGNGRFTDVSAASGIAKVAGRYGFTSLVSDYDNDGWPDIYLACDSTPNILFHNEGNGTFTDTGLLSGTAVNEDGQEQAGMGVAAGDYDRDGLIDLVKTNFADDTPTLYRNAGRNLFTDATYLARLGVNTRFLGWGAGFVDVDNDGWQDIFMVNGHVYPEVDALNSQSPFKQERVLFWNLRDKTFLDISEHSGAGVRDRRASRGAAFGDLDNDGGIEVIVNNLNDLPSLLKNTGARQNWVLFEMRGAKANRSGIGARVTISAGGFKQMDEVRSGGSFLSQNDLRLHFGLGKVALIERAEVLWPSGRQEVFVNLKANQVVVLEEGKGRAPNDKASKPKARGKAI